ncbi:MAG: hypothetical protein IPP32_13815 [Bacteroidetes bacterium]|nr:hypothetical protein [Bacteroidota bacterium]
MKQFVISILLIVTLFGGCKCKKESDTQAPFVSFISPQENQSFTVGETIPVKFQVSDETKIDYVQISVLDENQQQILSAITLHDVQDGQTIDQPILIDNTAIKSGSYYLTVRSSDGENEENTIRKIGIQELPLQRKAVYMIGKALNQYTVYKVDSVFSITTAYSLDGDFIGASIDSRLKRLITSGGFSGKLLATRLGDYSVAWSENPVGTVYPTYRNITTANALSFVSYNAGFVKAYDADGAIRFTASATQNVFYPIKSGVSSKYVLSEQAAFTGSTKKLVLYFYPSGGAVQELNFSGDVVEMFPKTDNDFFVFYNQGNTGMLSIYGASGTNFSYSYPSTLQGKIKSVVALSSEVYLISTENGIFKFTYNPLNYVLFKAGTGATKMRYDPSNNQVLAAEGKVIKMYDLTSGMLVNTITAVDSIADFQLLYNR